MKTDLSRLLLLRLAAGLCLVAAGGVGCALARIDSWPGLCSLAVHLAGLAVLYNVVWLWMERFGGRARLVRMARDVPQGCVIALIRALLILSTLAAAGCWAWFAVVDMNEVRMLLTAPRHTVGQIIGRDLVSPQSPVGYIGYSYRVSPSLAPEGRFTVPHSDYGRYRVGDRIAITYAAHAERVHRIGRVGWEYALRRAAYWLLVLVNGAGYLLLPLWVLEFRRNRSSGPPSRDLPAPGRRST